MQNGTSNAAHDEVKPRAWTKSEDIARRMLNLMFSLSVAQEPLTTEHIINDPEIGYTSPSRESRIKAFARDRESLASLGVHIREASDSHNAKNEQRSWEIDRTSTHADTAALSPYDAEEAVAAIDQIFALHADDPARWPLQMARTKLCETAGISPEGSSTQPLNIKRDLTNLWNAFSRRRPASFTYRDARGNENIHTVDLYGSFERGSYVYLVGRDHGANGLRTFRTDRVVSAKSSSESSRPYAIPSEFDITGSQFLPFDFSACNPVLAEFSFSPGVGAHEIELITKGRGETRDEEDGSTQWSVDVRDVDAAARFALEHAHIGLSVRGPKVLVDCVNLIKQKVVMAHEQQ